MTEQERIEQSIRDTLANETSAHTLSKALFHPSGLFAQLATSVEERRQLVRSPLFVEAQGRLSELQRQEGAAFGRAVAEAESLSVEGSLVLQLLDANSEAKGDIDATC